VERERSELERLAREQAAREKVERERFARERAEREQADAARVARDRLTQENIARERIEQTQRMEKERLEGERLARERVEREKMVANVQTAMLTPPPEPTPVKSAALSGSALVIEIKTELKRIGCYAGRLDDKWDTSNTKESVRKFVKFAKLQSEPDKPATELLDAVRTKQGRLCPLECGAREIESNGTCVPKTKDVTSAKPSTERKRASLGPAQDPRPATSTRPVPRTATGEKDWNQIAVNCVARYPRPPKAEGDYSHRRRGWSQEARNCIQAQR
jgi:hypothetical protein